VFDGVSPTFDDRSPTWQQATTERDFRRVRANTKRESESTRRGSLSGSSCYVVADPVLCSCQVHNCLIR
jgi:hypothetical protein